MTESVRDELLALSDHAGQRLRDRMAGLTDAEYRWQPAPAQPEISLTWRLSHIVEFLTEERNAVWLGQPAPPAPAAQLGEPADAAGALAALEQAGTVWRAVLAGGTDATLLAPVGKPAGRYAAATRLSFALHVLDELVHHAAEAALLRDLYAARTGKPWTGPAAAGSVPDMRRRH
jgi:hypothetical protein